MIKVRVFKEAVGPTSWPACPVIDGFKAGQVGHASPPKLDRQQVQGQAMWHLYNAGKPFSGRGSALDPAGSALHDPVVGGEKLVPLSVL